MKLPQWQWVPMQRPIHINCGMELEAWLIGITFEQLSVRERICSLYFGPFYVTFSRAEK